MVPPQGECPQSLRNAGVRLVQLLYVDMLGVQKGLTLPARQAACAWGTGVRVDGASLEGFIRVEEREMRLRADPRPWCRAPGADPRLSGGGAPPGLYARRGRPFAGCPRQRLRAAAGLLDELKLRVEFSFEVEFYLLHRQAGQPVLESPDRVGYMDLSVRDAGEPVRRRIAMALEEMGLAVESAHHAVAPAQHEIDLGWQTPLVAADHLMLCKLAVYELAERAGLHATFLPKPRVGDHGSGLHVRMRLTPLEGCALDRAAATRHWLAGLLHHARPLCALTNPLVNSYKRLVPGFEAPVHVIWGRKGHAPLVRVVDDWDRGELELRGPDPCCHPYLALAALLRAGADGIRRGLVPPPPVEENVLEMPPGEIAARRIEALPGSLGEALDDMRGSGLLRDTLGEYLFNCYLEAKRMEWDIYRVQVHQWELEQYLPVF
ncbi:MAG: glutamine synthetase [Bacillota bacterium]|nr:MAG: glutamine synthetase [Bacillota bacterium]